MTTKVLAVLGAGMQGTAAAYDMARFGAATVRLFDHDGARAAAGAERINALLGRAVATGAALDARDGAAVTRALAGVAVTLSGLPYYLNLGAAKAAIAAGSSFGDLGGNTDVVWQELALDGEARARGVCVVPDLGLAPGLGNTLAAYALERVRGARRISVRCGGLPQVPRPPLEYKLVFSVEGLTNEYFGKAAFLRDGRRVEVDTFDELEAVAWPGMPALEAFTTSGGTSTCPWTFEGRLESYDYKTIRYAGHFAKVKLLKDLGLLDLDPIDVLGAQVVPREVFHSLARARLAFPADRDLVLLRVTCEGADETLTLSLRDDHDEATGFTAMERTTAYPASIVCLMMAAGEVSPGAHRLEAAVEPARCVEALRLRGFNLVEERAARA
jgi:lysine 6-dehydrogenase